MNSNQILISAAMLEAVWESRKKDMIDLITPFIMHATASLTSPGDVIDINKVLEVVKESYGYSDMPSSIVTSVYNRNVFSCIERKNRQYILKSPIDKEVESMNRRKKECETYLDELGKELAEYLNMHCRKSGMFDTERSIASLHDFFTRYGLQVGTESLINESISHREYEVDYYIAQYIYECSRSKQQKYDLLLDLIKGYFLRLAIYMQPDNSSLKTATYARVTFVYDTPFLLDLLGYSGKEREEKALAMHQMLKAQKAQFGYFPHIFRELIDILTAYKYSLSPHINSIGTRTLPGLNAKGYKPSDVDREITLLASTLKNKFAAIEIDTPEYEVNDNGIITDKVLPEEEMKIYIRENTPHYNDENLDNDICSVLAIHRMRKEKVCNTIEMCPAILVTNNYNFTKANNDFYKNNIDSRTFPLVISDSNLSALTWIKCGDMGNLPERELLKNAYSAMQPIPELMKKIEMVLNKMKDLGEITAEEVIALRSSRVFQNNVWTNSFGNLECVNETSVREAQEVYKKHLVHDISDEYEKKISELNEKSLNKETRQRAKSKLKADEFARLKRDNWIKKKRRIWVTLICIVFTLGVIGMIYSAKIINSYTAILTTGIFLLISAISLFDTIFSKKKHLYNWLEKRANQYETNIREKKLEEYMTITSDE